MLLNVHNKFDRKSLNIKTEVLEDAMFQPYRFTEKPKHINDNSSTLKVIEEDG